jgi:hypothetical protein
MPNVLKRFALLAALPALLFLSACDRHDHDDDHAGLTRVLLETRGTADPQPIAEWTRTGGWNVQSLPALTVGTADNNFGRASWTVRMWEGDEELNLNRPQQGGPCGEYSARFSVDGDAVLFNPGETGQVMVGGQARESFHCNHVHLYPRAAGTANVRFVLWHVDHADGRTDPIQIAVQAP